MKPERKIIAERPLAQLCAELVRTAPGPAELAVRNANYVGGDIASGATSGLQLLLRPKPSLFPSAPPTRPSSSAPRPPRPALACTACRATTRRRPCGGGCGNKAERSARPRWYTQA